MMKNVARISNRVSQIPKSAIHEMTRLSKEVDDVAFLSWVKPTAVRKTCFLGISLWEVGHAEV